MKSNESKLKTPQENPLCRKLGPRFLEFQAIDGPLTRSNDLPFDLKDETRDWLETNLPGKWSLVYGRMITTGLNASQTVLKQNVDLDMYLEFEDRESLLWFELVWK